MAKTMLSWLSFLLAGPYSTVLPFVLFPWVCRWIVERVIGHINIAAFSLRWRAFLTGFTACMPGLVNLSLLSFSAGCIFHAVPDDFDCHIEMYGPLVIVIILMCRATMVLLRQALTVRRLLASAQPPCGALLRIAEGMNLSLVELPTRVPVCMVLGARSPRVVVSTGMLNAFSDEELRAALWHEKAHIERRDTRYNVLISFLSNCGVWRVRNALREYRQACEELADRRATREVSAIVLAETLIRFARNSWQLPFAEALADDNDLKGRVRRLLDSQASLSSATRVLWPLALLILVSAVMVSYPVFARHIGVLLTHCFS